MISLEVSALYRDWMLRNTHFAIREVYSVGVKRMTAFCAVFGVRIIAEEGGEMLEKEVGGWSLSICGNIQCYV